MKVPLNIAKQLLQLCKGDRIPGSKMKHAIFSDMIENGILSKHMIGRSKSIMFLQNRKLLEAYLKNHFGINDLDSYVYALTDVLITKTDAILASSDSKIKSIRSFRGFPVNSFNQVTCTLNNEPFIINPVKGSFSFIIDFRNFLPDPALTIVGVENADNFIQLEKQRGLFSHLNALFVCRYPQSNDLIQWLKMIPNNYIHYGDLDMAGLNIYINEYKKHLKERAEFYLPPDPESLFIKFGNRGLYQKQKRCFDITEMKERNVEVLYQLINKYRKGVEQEILIHEGPR